MRCPTSEWRSLAVSGSSCGLFEERRDVGAWTQAVTRFARAWAAGSGARQPPRDRCRLAWPGAARRLRGFSPGRRVVLTRAGSAASSTLSAIASALEASCAVQNRLWTEVLRLRSGGPAGRTCAACARELDLLLAEHPVFHRIRRKAPACPRCGIVEDIDPRGDVRQIGVFASSAWVRGTEQAIQLRIAPDQGLTAPVHVQAGIYPRNADRLGVEVPPPAAVTLLPDRDSRWT
jgi:hypothetical protein